MFRTIGIGNAVFRTGQLPFDLGSPVVRSLFLDFVAHYIWQLDDKIQFFRSQLVIHHVHQVQLADQALDGAVRFVHHRIERVLDQGHFCFRQGDLLFLPGLVVIHFQPHIIGVPFLHLCHPHGKDLFFAGLFVHIHIHRHQRCHALVQYREEHVIPQRPAGLVLVAGKVQTAIKARINGFVVASVFIEPYVVYCDARCVHGNAGVYGGHDRTVIRTVQPYPVRPVAAPSAIVVLPGRVPVRKGVPRPFQAGANRCFTSHRCLSYSE